MRRPEESDYTCPHCEAEFEITHDAVNAPMWCPFCGEHGLSSSSDEPEEEDYRDED